MAGAQSTSHAPSEKELTHEHSFIYLIVKKVFHLRAFQIHPFGRSGYLAARCSHCSYINSWNLTSLTISDVSFTNTLPPKWWMATGTSPTLITTPGAFSSQVLRERIAYADGFLITHSSCRSGLRSESPLAAAGMDLENAIVAFQAYPPESGYRPHKGRKQVREKYTPHF